jgi:hypothetical protein
VRPCWSRRPGYRSAMTTDPQSPYADPADVAEQQQDAVPPAEEEDIPDRGPDEVPLEADEADVAEQRFEVPEGVDDDLDEA